MNIYHEDNSFFFAKECFGISELIFWMIVLKLN